MRFYRFYLRDHLHMPYNEKATEEEIDRAINAELEKPFGDDEAHTIRFRMAGMIPQWQEEIYRNRARSGGKGKAKKKGKLSDSATPK
jgi:hypothetical protein